MLARASAFVNAVIMSAREVAKKLRAELYALRKRVRTWRPVRAAILEPTTEIKIMTVVIYSLCQDAKLAAIWAQRRQDTRRRHDKLWPVCVSQVQVGTWFQEFGQDPRVKAALASFDHTDRIKADTFLMESLVADEVEEQNRKGLAMCPKLMLLSYLRKWNMRPRSQDTEEWLAALQADKTKQDEWRRGFRRRWKLEWSNLPEARCLGKADIKARTEAYLRWVRWVLFEALAGQDTLVVNMDETMMANIKERSKGVVVNAQRKRQLDHTTNAKRRVCPRCSLLGSITTDDDLQKHLPQIFLPRGSKDKHPPQTVRDVFSRTSAPVEGWHRTCGFLSTDGAACFLSRLSGVVRRHPPRARIVLV